MIDFHAHVLPEIDDGSKDVSESIEMLRLSLSEGNEIIVATPHFYVERSSITSFLDKRLNSAHLLTEALKDMNSTSFVTDIYLGAEVYFYQGISNNEHIRDLTINNTNYLLLEMPFTQWSKSVLSEVQMLISNVGVTPILAHVDRYLHFRDSLRGLDTLLELGCLAQMNTSYLMSWRNRISAMKLIKSERIHVLGTDMHNITTRPPIMRKPLEFIERQCGNQYIEMFERNSKAILDANNFKPII